MELPYLEARDEDGGIYGDISFEIVDNIVGKLALFVIWFRWLNHTGFAGSEDSTYFDIIKVDNKRSQIYLKEMILPKFYKVSLSLFYTINFIIIYHFCSVFSKLRSIFEQKMVVVGNLRGHRI